MASQASLEQTSTPLVDCSIDTDSPHCNLLTLGFSTERWSVNLLTIQCDIYQGQLELNNLLKQWTTPTTYGTLACMVATAAPLPPMPYDLSPVAQSVLCLMQQVTDLLHSAQHTATQHSQKLDNLLASSTTCALS